MAAAKPALASVPARRVSKVNAADRLSPVVRKLCAEHALDPRNINGTGRDGRITREDVLGFIAQRASTGIEAGQPAAIVAPTLAAGQAHPLTAVRRRVADNMLKSWTTAPHVMQAVEADYIGIDAARRGAKDSWKSKEGTTLTFLPFVVRAV